MKLNVAAVGEARHAQRALVTRGEIFFLFGGFHGRHFHHGAGHTLLGVGIDQRGGHRALLCRSHGRRAGEEENQECFFHYSISPHTKRLPNVRLLNDSNICGDLEYCLYKKV